MNENQLVVAICNQLVQVIVNLGGTATPISGYGQNLCQLLRIQLELTKQIVALT